MLPVSSTKYSPVDEQEDYESEELLASSSSHRTRRSSLLRWERCYRFWPWLGHAVLVCLYTVTFLTLSIRLQSPTGTQCIGLLSTYSPVHEVVEYQTRRFNGSLDFPSPYQGPPSPAVDAAWDRISTNNTLRPIRVSDATLEEIHKSNRPSNVRFHARDGGGNMASIEVFHQLHCLNMLRKFTYPDDYPGLQDLWRTRPEFMRSHLDHCIEIIRQNLMCAGDVGVITYDWIEGWNVPFPDFNTWHQCRNFDKILEWSDNHRVHIPREHITRLGDEIDLSQPPQ